MVAFDQRNFEASKQNMDVCIIWWRLGGEQNVKVRNRSFLNSCVNLYITEAWVKLQV